MENEESTSVRPKSWEGQTNPLKEPGVAKRPVGRPRKDAGATEATTAAGIGSEAVERRTAPSGRKGRKLATRPAEDLDFILLDEGETLPQSFKPDQAEKDLTARRLSILQDQPGRWMRLRVYASKSGAADVSRQVARSALDKPQSRFHRAFYIEGKTESRVVVTKVSENPDRFNYEVWARFTPETEPPL